jgi:PAS domain S-box-containing protein
MEKFIKNPSLLLEFFKKKFRKPRPNDKEYSFSQADILVSKTDLKGNITYTNELFIKITGYSQEELLGKPHNIVRHPKMPKIIFKLLWQQLKTGKEINAFVINLTKDGGFYWVFANITPSFNENNQVIGFHSTRRRPNRRALKIIQPLYKQLRMHEIVGGMEESEEIFQNFLKKKGVTYDKFIFDIQHS